MGRQLMESQSVSTARQDQELYDFCLALFGKVRARLPHVHLSTNADWDDIRATAIERVFRFRHLRDPARPFGPWAYTVMWRVTQNELRSRFLGHPSKDRKWKLYLRRPSPLQTVIVIDDEDGNERVEVVPDLAAESDDHAQEEKAEFLATLSAAFRHQLELLQRGKLGYASLPKNRRFVAQLNQLWRVYLDGGQVGHWKLPSRHPRIPNVRWLRKQLKRKIHQGRWDSLRALHPDLPPTPEQAREWLDTISLSRKIQGNAA